jgi:hypothetical protein
MSSHHLKGEQQMKHKYLFIILIIFFGCKEASVEPQPKEIKYCALVTQWGTDDPSAVVLENTLSGDPQWKRLSIGKYYCTLRNGFPAGKTFVLMNPNVGGANCNVTYVNDSIIQFTTFNSGVLCDNFLYSASIIIQVYH